MSEPAHPSCLLPVPIPVEKQGEDDCLMQSTLMGPLCQWPSLMDLATQNCSIPSSERPKHVQIYILNVCVVWFKLQCESPFEKTLCLFSVLKR